MCSLLFSLMLLFFCIFFCSIGDSLEIVFYLLQPPTHLFCISVFVKSLYLFQITLLHLSFHIRCADLAIRILYNLFFPVLGFPSPSIEIATLQPSIEPIDGYFHVSCCIVHSFLMRFHTSSCPDKLHSESTCSIVSSVLHDLHSLHSCISSGMLGFCQ